MPTLPVQPIGKNEKVEMRSGCLQGEFFEIGGIGCQLSAVGLQKKRCGSDPGSLVAVHKRVAMRPPSGTHSDKFFCH
jgi:hypothetical protein